MADRRVESQMREDDAIWNAIDLGGGQCCDIPGIARELDRAGFVIVPKEPTDEMITAGLIPTAAWLNIAGSALTVNREKMRLRYKAMIDAINGRRP